MATEVKERSVPKPVFTDAEAGAQEFPSWQSRSYNYFTPRKRRATVYEDVTVDVQPDPARHLSQGWVYAFADGIAGYPQEWSALKSSNWHEFLDPNEEWEQTIYRNNANVVRQISQNIEHGRTAHVFAAMNPAWVKILERHVFAWAHAEHGLGMHVYTPAQRDAPTNMINNAMAVGAVHKLRFAQDLILYNLALSEEIDGFDGSIHKATWQDDAVWQPTRELVESLTGIRDWSEALFVTTVVFEPLVGELFRSGFVMQAAAPQGDFVTPTIMGAGESDAAREQTRRPRTIPHVGRRPEPWRREQADDGGLARRVDATGGRGGPQPAADLVPAVREGRALRGLVRPLARPLREPGRRHRPRGPEGGHGMTEFKSDPTSSNMAGVTLMNNQVGHVVAEVMRGKSNVTVTELPSMIRVDGQNQFDFNYEEMAEALGWDDFGNDDFEEIMSTHYGRMVVLDDRIVMFANPEDAAEYIGFDLQPVT